MFLRLTPSDHILQCKLKSLKKTVMCSWSLHLYIYYSSLRKMMTFASNSNVVVNCFSEPKVFGVASLLLLLGTSFMKLQLSLRFEFVGEQSMETLEKSEEVSFGGFLIDYSDL